MTISDSTSSGAPFYPNIPEKMLSELNNILHNASNILLSYNRAEYITGILKKYIGFEVDKDNKQMYSILLLIRDLYFQGWSSNFVNGVPYFSQPKTTQDTTTKDYLRKALLNERDKYLEATSVKAFVHQMLKGRKHNGKKKTIKNLIADPIKLMSSLSTLGPNAVKPYLQIIQSPLERDTFTGYRLLDIWRFFRLTWSLPHKSTPGRKIFILVRDAGQENHPILGIAALGNSIVQISSRDDVIGWSFDGFIKRFPHCDDKSAELIILKLRKTLERAISEIATDDLPIQDLTRLEKIKILESFSKENDENDPPKRVKNDLDPLEWFTFSRSALYRQKRARTLLGLLKAEEQFSQVLSEKPLSALKKLLSTNLGKSAIKTAVSANKNEKVGTNIMDIIVCGAIPPYNELLAGKLIALLMMSPEIYDFYERRYKGQVSIIASGLKGAPIIRNSSLVFLGTTSLYETGSSQYNRVYLPKNAIGESTPSKRIGYEKIGTTKGFGTVYISDETVEAFSNLLIEHHGRKMITNSFGEGTSPRLRLIRAGLNLLGLPSDYILTHNFKRIVYGVALAENTFEFLRGEDDVPRYCFNSSFPRQTSEAICEFWRQRWLSMRIKNDDVMDRVKNFDSENLIRILLK
ncbi:DUF4338 domain-containing protein [Paenibacillus alginolyticus]|uniref:Druantia anti-phage system protein DruA n=1 Tax=Paenibacillus alginolyticus TaxID=59839 RepID=UPI0004273619|nr:Druantia anti-phage system protein DruA [Paenibacillus alginolyticus]MCY9665127.1 DUF4338 domain-containing protein [Paenibacillus alginolyticus]